MGCARLDLALVFFVTSAASTCGRVAVYSFATAALPQAPPGGVGKVYDTSSSDASGSGNVMAVLRLQSQKGEEETTSRSPLERCWTRFGAGVNHPDVHQNKKYRQRSTRSAIETHFQASADLRLPSSTARQWAVTSPSRRNARKPPRSRLKWWRTLSPEKQLKLHAVSYQIHGNGRAAPPPRLLKTARPCTPISDGPRREAPCSRPLAARKPTPTHLYCLPLRRLLNRVDLDGERVVSGSGV